jgi:hypothetical protein
MHEASAAACLNLRVRTLKQRAFAHLVRVFVQRQALA